MPDLNSISIGASKLAKDAVTLSEKLKLASNEAIQVAMTGGIDPFIFAITIFALACFVGYFVVWRVTPALHTPLMSVTNAISGIIIVGAIIAVGPEQFGKAQIIGFFAIILASINIFGGFVVTQRMLAMFRKKS
jgi:NAD(P) transhydrogenase subunit alpha